MWKNFLIYPKTFAREEDGASFFGDLNENVDWILSFKLKTRVVSGTQTDDLSVL